MTIRAHFRLYIVGLVTLLLIGMMILTSCCDGGEPVVPTDTQSPEVYITWDPFLPEHGDYITFTILANDDGGILQLAIGVNNDWEICYEDMSGCQGGWAETYNVQCDRDEGPYSQGQTLQFEARAWDCAGNEGRSHIQTIIVGP